jgi:DeoR/GlpR family transcriptional regulator of sugar metabolism
VVFHRVDGRGVFREAVRQALDALQTHPAIDIAFGANDHTILGAIEAAQRTGGMRLDCYSVGGEGNALFDELSRDGPLRATLALFPEVVGRIAIDASCRHFVGQDIGNAVLTPAEILTPESLPGYYMRDGDHWRLRPEVMNRMTSAWTYAGAPQPGRTVGFILHYPSHEWYRNLAAAMRERCSDFGIEFTSRNAEDEVAQQIRGIRRLIGAAAASEVHPRQTILVDGGEASRFFAEALRDSPRDITVVTNSLAVVESVAGVPGIKALLTGGEYQAATRSLVGPSVGALLQTMRADRAIVSPDGMASGFGASFEDERAALVCRRFAEAAREVVVLADHSVVGLESTVQAIRPGQVHAVFTDAGTLSSHRLDLSSAGIRVALADEDIPAYSQAGSAVSNKVQQGGNHG